MHVLVCAASKHGATREIAEAIAETFREAGLTADRLDPEQVESVEPYDAVILGSGIYAGRWLEPARSVTERHYAQLRARPLWLFSSGPIGDPLAPTEEPPDGARLLRELDAREHRVFAGRLNTSDLSWVERTITGMLRAPNGDFRDWTAIRAWADEIAAALRSKPVGGCGC
jgi:menaquinone-dependent protoporphyrinogen oxidase